MSAEKKVNFKKARELYKASGAKIVEDSIDSFVSIRDVDKIYPNGVQAVFHFNLDIKEKEFIVFVGPSGCGKSTTLRMIAGLEEITNGKLYIDKVLANTKSPDQRDIAMVFQSYALYPHMNVYDNMSFGLKINKAMLPLLDKEGKPVSDENGKPLLVKRHYTKDEINDLVFGAARILNLGDYLDRKPKELSGGQMQRVALGRAIVRRPKLFLMDEPLSNLDAKLRISMRSEILKIHHRVGATTIYVTHDQTEAMTMADRIVVMNMGHISQVDTPRNIYENPSNLFGAIFIGSPSINLMNVTYADSTITFGNGSALKLQDGTNAKIKAFFDSKLLFYKQTLQRFELRHHEILPVLKSLLRTKNEAKIQELLGLHYLCEREQEIKDLLAKVLSEQKYKNDVRKIMALIEEKDHVLSSIVDELDANKPNTEAHKPVVLNKKNKGVRTPHEEKEILEKLISYFEKGYEHTNLILGVRPEFFALGDANSPVKGKVFLQEYLGTEKYVYFSFLEKEYVVRVSSKEDFKRGGDINLTFDLHDVHLFDPVTGLSIA